MNTAPVYSEILKAHERIEKYIHRTPVLKSDSINVIAGGKLFFKCENFQKVGAFKYRGATNAVLQLSKEELKKGVATHSSGNHAQALALAARKQGVPAYIVMPDNSPDVKKEAVKSYGAIITFCKPTLQAREETLDRIIEKTGATFIHPYNNPDVIAGQGTAAFELLTDYPEIEIIMAPVGGGGLLSGTAIASKGKNKSIQVIGAEPLNADDAFRSFMTKRLIPSENPKTICDGLLTSLGTITFSVIMDSVDKILTASEESIVEAMRIIWQRMKIIVEPSSAVPLAVILENKSLFEGKKTGIIISGGNVDISRLPFNQV